MSEIHLESLLAKQLAVRQQIPQNLALEVYVCAFGATGAGKSALLSYMIDYSKMEFQSDGLGYSLKHPNSTQMPTIGNTNNSQTEIPTCYKKPGMNFIDLPGIFDTKGSLQEVINSFSNSLIFRKNNSFKFVIVVELSSLQERRGSTFVDVITRMETLLGQNFASIAESSILVVSKLMPEVHKYEKIKQQITSIINSHDGIKPDSDRHKLIKHILDNNQLFLFPVPQSISPQLIDNIEKNVTSLKPSQLKYDSKVGLSEQAKNHLSNEVNKRVTLIRQDISVIAKNIENKYKIRYPNQTNINTNTNILNQAQAFRAQLSSMKINFPLKNFTQSLSIGNLPQIDGVIKSAQQLNSLEKFYSQSTKSYQNQIIKLFTSITTCKSHLQNETQRIQNEAQVQRRRIQAENQRREAQRRYEQSLRIAEQQRQARIREENERIARERAAAEAEAARVRAAQEAERQRLEAERIRLQQQHYDDSSDDDCMIM